MTENRERIMKILKIAILLIIVTLIVTQTNVLDVFRPKTAYAVGDLNVNWGAGVTPGDPIFSVNNMAPGDSESRNVVLTNNATTARPVAVKGVPTDNSDNLSDAMDITISNGSTILYGPKTVSEFFTDSTDPEGILLETINPGSSRTITFLVTFRESAGNEFQNDQLVFDIIIGISVDIPTACGDVDLNGRFPIFGTSGNDTLRGSNKDDVIFGLEGNDKIDSGNGDDCIVGGAGNDVLGSGNGKDIVTGNAGSDEIDGGNGADNLSGDEDNDDISGGNEDDIIAGGSGADVLNAGNGNDTVTGNDGNDTIKGGNGSDSLTGGNNSDTINGDLGKDSCSGESLKNCETVL
jgi:Ca2+-binding RTX toxin-like protein